MMFSLRTAVLFLASLRAVFAAQSLPFVPPSTSPTQPSPNYVGKSNFTLPRAHFKKGIAFDQFIVILMENTDFAAARSTPAFQTLATQGITFTNSHGVNHPSQPNYVAMNGGYTFGLEGDQFVYIPANVSGLVDLLEEQQISWASYQENMPCNGYNGKTYSSFNYLAGNGTDAFYQRKHEEVATFNSTSLNPRRAALRRNFNDFAADIQADALPQFLYITPSIVNDAHDTGIDFGSRWLEYFLLPLLKDSRFNGPNTLILVTFDENETGPENNLIETVAVGNAVPKNLRGTTDDTYLTHYTVLTTAQINWGLNCLGRQDTNRTMANVLPFVAKAAKFQNTIPAHIPLTNGSVRFSGPLNTDSTLQTPWLAPDSHAKCVNPKGKVYFNPDPPVNPDIFINGQCPQVAVTSNPSLLWSTALDAKIIARQRECLSSTMVIDPSEL